MSARMKLMLIAVRALREAKKMNMPELELERYIMMGVIARTLFDRDIRVNINTGRVYNNTTWRDECVTWSRKWMQR